LRGLPRRDDATRARHGLKTRPRRSLWYVPAVARLATVSFLLALSACPAGTKPPPSPPPAAALPHEPIDVPVFNAARSEELQRLGPARAVWTGSEAVYVSLGVTSLWLGRIDVQGRQLAEAIEVPLGHPVSGGSAPTWVDGTIAAVYRVGERSHWIRVRPSGEVVVDQELESEAGWFLAYAEVAYAGAAGFALVARPTAGDGATRLVPFGLDGQRLGVSVDLGCSTPYALTGLTNGVAFACRAPSPGSTKEEDGFVAVVQQGKTMWRHAVRPGGHLVLGTDGTRVLATYEDDPTGPDAFEDPHIPVRVDLLGPTGALESSTVVPSVPPELRAQVIWTGNEFATASDRWLFRYGRDGTPVGIWDVEPQCNREFHATTLLWTGAQYLVIGDWGWRTCPAPLRPDAGPPTAHPLAPGLRWDPATDAIESPYDDW